MTLFSLVKIKTHLRFCRKSSGECVGALCFSRKLIHLCRSVATTIIGRAVTIQAARSSMWRVDFRVVAAAFDSGTYRHAEAVCPPYRTKMQTSASVCILERTSSGMDETCRLRRGEGDGACEDEPPEAQLRYYRILPHAGACRQPLRQNLRFDHLPLHRGGFGRTASSAPRVRR